MDYLQYGKYDKKYSFIRREVLNLIINGLPSILFVSSYLGVTFEIGFKPYYKWITFNTGLMIMIMILLIMF